MIQKILSYTIKDVLYATGYFLWYVIQVCSFLTSLVTLVMGISFAVIDSASHIINWRFFGLFVALTATVNIINLCIKLVKKQ